MRLFILTTLLLFAFNCSAQVNTSLLQTAHQYHIKKTTAPVKIDGILTDECWQTNEAIEKLWMKFPTNDTTSNTPLNIKLSYDAKNLYIGATIYDTAPLIGQSLKRDSRLRENDGFGIVLDPFNKKLNGYYFSVTAFNVQADDVFSGNNTDLTFSWDNKWYSETKQYNDHYVVEMAIPFNALRYDANNKTWGLNFIHSQRKKNEFHTWTKMPLNFAGVDLGYTGALVWDAQPPVTGKNIAVIPFITGGLTKNKIDNTPLKGNIEVGLDARIALNSALNLDVAVNPDFSQIEVDRQVTNLSRFNIFLPERRTFFLENSDLFSEYGNPTIRPFYSRTIGLDANGNALPILGGVRLSGNIAKRTRIGVMNMQTAKNNDNAPNNYTSINIQQQVLKRSSIKGYFLNHETFDSKNSPLKNAIDKYGRNAGLDLGYTSNDGVIQAWGGLHNSIKPTIKKQNNYLNFGGGIFKQKYEVVINYDDVGQNYYTDLGYVQLLNNRDDVNDTTYRIGYKNWFNFLTYNIYPKKSKVNQYKFSLESNVVHFTNGTFVERNNNFSFEIRFRNTSNIVAFNNSATTQLAFPTAFTDATPLPKGRYNYNSYGLNYNSDTRKNFAYSTGLLNGTYFGGKYSQVRAGVIYRKQPYFTFELNAEYNNLKFAAPYGSTELFLIAPRIEVNFSNTMFWTTFLQYNTQSNNFNVNSRLQWRYKPASDLFVVYTDNYFADPLFKNKNRALVFKLNKWFNL